MNILTERKTVMKKLIALVLAAALCLGVSVMAFADAGGPMIRSVDCTVTNPNGATFYYFDYDEETETDTLLTKTIAYKTVVTVTAEYDPSWLTEKDKTFEGKKIGGVNFRGQYGYIDLADVTIADGEFSLNDAQRLTHPETYTVTGKNGFVMYAGPSQIFEETGKIPTGATIKLTYRDVGEDENYADSFYYAEYNGKGGWIFKYSEAESFYLLRKLDKYSIYTGEVKVVGEGFRLVDIFNEKKDAEGYYDGYNETGPVIPAGTVLRFDSYYDIGEYALVEYNGTKGYVALDSFSEDAPQVITYINDDIMLMDDCETYTAFDDFESATGETVPEYTILPVKAVCRYGIEDVEEWNNYDWYLTEYNGKDVWICDTDDDFRRFYRNREYRSYYKIKGATAELFKTDEDDSEVACTVTKDDVLREFLFSYDDDTEITRHYVEVVGSDKAGWINEDNINYLNNYAEPYVEEEETTVEETEAADVKTGEQDEAAGALDAANPASAIEKAAKSSNRMIIVCVAAAAVIALTAGVTIALIKKKKGDK